MVRAPEPPFPRERFPVSRAVASSEHTTPPDSFGTGRALGPAERTYFEPRLGWDLGGVRVHENTTTAAHAKSLGARAFTSGQHIGFEPGQYRPDAVEGRRLLGHELVHTLQQRGQDRGMIQCSKHTGQADYFDPDNCWVPGRTDGPTSNVIGRFIGILDVPDTFEGAIKMTVRFEVIGTWSVLQWLGGSGGPLLINHTATGIDPASFVKGKKIVEAAFFEYDVTLPLTAENRATAFDATLLVIYRIPNHQLPFAEVEFARRISWDKAMNGQTPVDSSPEPMVRVDSCGKLKPSTPTPPTSAP